MNDHAEPEKIMVAGDWHGETGWAKGVIERAGRLGVTKLLHVGDLGIGPWPGQKAGATFEHKLSRVAQKNGVTLHVVPGNHENFQTLSKLEPRADGWLELREHVLVAPGGLRWTWSGVEFGALGGAYSVDAAHRTAGKDWWPDLEEVRPEHLERLDSEPLDVLVSHDAPAGVDLFRTFKLGAETATRAQVSRDLLAEAVRRTAPEAIFCGHWHQRRTAYLPLPEGTRTGRQTVAERHQGADPGEQLTRTRVEVLDLGREYVGADGRTDQNWVLLSLADLTCEEQRAVEARMRRRETTDRAPDHPGLDLETARGAYLVRSASATRYYLDLDNWRLLRVPGEGSSTGPWDGVWVPLASVENRAGESRIDVGNRHRYLTEPDPGGDGARWWVQRPVTAIEPVERADLPPAGLHVRTKPVSPSPGAALSLDPPMGEGPGWVWERENAPLNWDDGTCLEFR